MRRVLIAAVAALIAFLYAGTARGLVVQWLTSPDASYGLILGAVSAALVWKRRHLLVPDVDYPLATAAALLTLAGGCVMLLAGLVAADLFVTRASFVVVCGALIWFLAGHRALRAMAVPLLFLLLAIPLPELLVNAITLPLQLIASALAETTLSAAGVPVFRDGNVLELPAVTLQVAEACSGLRSAISLTCVAVLLAWAARGSFRRRAIVIALAPPIAVVTNGLRIAVTGMASETWGPAAARGVWHETTGWITFVVSVALLAVIHRALTNESEAVLHPRMAEA
ncbi:MAG TPA: exosortase/archaeosortase family protein [Vicinamibacterales bacterium]|jgi:exosortase